MSTRNDSIQKPKHYAQFKIEPIHFILSNNLGYCEGNIVKYICRYKLKHTGKKRQVEDLRKARQYLDILIRGFNEQHK